MGVCPMTKLYLKKSTTMLLSRKHTHTQKMYQKYHYRNIKDDAFADFQL